MEELSSDTDFLRDKYSKARNKYRPGVIRILLVAEAPPCVLDRFFYFEDVKKQDSLFLEICGVLYPDKKGKYLACGRETDLKIDLLENFKSDGFWLLDLIEIPTNISGNQSATDVNSLLKRIEKVIDKSTPIIFIKVNVFDVCYEIFSANGYNAINERLPFPGSGQQKVFRERFRSALQVCG